MDEFRLHVPLERDDLQSVERNQEVVLEFFRKDGDSEQITTLAVGCIENDFVAVCIGKHGGAKQVHLPISLYDKSWAASSKKGIWINIPEGTLYACPCGARETASLGWVKVIYTARPQDVSILLTMSLTDSGYDDIPAEATTAIFPNHGDLCRPVTIVHRKWEEES